ncbi:MAG: hypothetical protein H7330_13070 [Hymenobacteraceae bacterium]|nr:hypothetical protein [Hymenobacteraceae bacterium]
MPPERPNGRPTSHVLAAALAALDPLPADIAPLLSAGRLRAVVFQWLAVLEVADIAELAGLTDDLRQLTDALSDAGATADGTPVGSTVTERFQSGRLNLPAALHRAGLSLERVAAWARPASLTDQLLALGRQLVALGEQPATG